MYRSAGRRRILSIFPEQFSPEIDLGVSCQRDASDCILLLVKKKKSTWQPNLTTAADGQKVWYYIQLLFTTECVSAIEEKKRWFFPHNVIFVLISCNIHLVENGLISSLTITANDYLLHVIIISINQIIFLST